MAEHIDLSEERHYQPVANLHNRYKLLNNLDRVLEWIQTGDTLPFFINITLTNRCTHRCAMCTSKDLLDNRTAPFERIKDLIVELKELGVKAIGLGGGGDPTCHPNYEEILRFIGAQGLEIGTTTNGQLLTPGMINAAVQHCTWIRVSLDGGSADVYHRVHGMTESDFAQVQNNIRALVAEKKRLNSPVTIGTTFLLGQHTLAGAYEATALAKELGVDYIRLRPFFIWNNTKKSKGSEEQADLVSLGKKRTGGRSLDLKRTGGEEFFVSAAEELERCRALGTENFSVSFPENRVRRQEAINTRVHRACSVHFFSVVVSADLNVYPCCMLEDSPKYSMGNLAHQTFRELWQSDARRQAYERIDFSDCPNPCMSEGHNELLWELRENELRSDTAVSDLLRATRVKIPHANFL